MVFEPLGAVHQGGHPGACVEVLDLHDRLVTARVPQRVVVHLHKSIDVVDVALGVLHPIDVVQAPLFEVTRLVICHEVAKRSSLLVVLRILDGLVQPFDDFCDALAVEAIELVNILNHIAFRVLFKAAVQAVFNGAAVVLVRNGFEVRFGLFRGHVRRIEVHRGTFHEALGAVLFHLFGLHRWIEDDGPQFRVQAVASLCEQMVHVSLAEAGLVLGVGVVVVDAVGKPNALQVHLKCLPSHRVAVAFVGGVNVFEQPTDAEVVTVVLVVHDVATAEARHVEAVDQRLLLGAELLPARDLVTDNFQIGKLFRLPNKAFLVRRARFGIRRRSGRKISTFAGGRGTT